MANLVGLKDAKYEVMPCAFIHSLSDLNKLSFELPLTTADSNGAINIWISKDGLINCDVYRYMRTIESKTFKYKKEVRQWFKYWRDEIK